MAKLLLRHAVRALRLSPFIVVVTIIAVSGCRQRMADQPHQRPLDSSTFFADGMASRPIEPGTVARAGVEENPYVLTGKINGKPGAALPFPMTAALLARGQERYEIFCSPCHDRLGTGQGMIVRRGFRPARSFHEPRLRDAPAGHFFEVITLGFGPMPSYASQLSPRDRWAVIAYIRALQFSRNARVGELPQQDRDKLKDVQ
jgi:mono/diheme cytochrome c family protein